MVFLSTSFTKELHQQETLSSSVEPLLSCSVFFLPLGHPRCLLGCLPVYSKPKRIGEPPPPSLIHFQNWIILSLLSVWFVANSLKKTTCRIESSSPPPHPNNNAFQVQRCAICITRSSSRLAKCQLVCRGMSLFYCVSTNTIQTLSLLIPRRSNIYKKKFKIPPPIQSDTTIFRQ